MAGNLEGTGDLQERLNRPSEDEQQQYDGENPSDETKSRVLAAIVMEGIFFVRFADGRWRKF